MFLLPNGPAIVLLVFRAELGTSFAVTLLKAQFCYQKRGFKA